MPVGVLIAIILILAAYGLGRAVQFSIDAKSVMESFKRPPR